MSKKLIRATDDVMIAGVAAGVANYLNIDPVLVRILFVLLSLAGGHGLFIYLILWFLMPQENLAAKIDMS
jgi:phage shock protein C